jgi:enamine deaminase RidA (YjgF/YER057c/UK114 family)
MYHFSPEKRGSGLETIVSIVENNHGKRPVAGERSLPYRPQTGKENAMTGRIEQRLAELGIALPQAAAPAASYVPYCRSGRLIFTAGQLPMVNGKMFATGILGRDLSTSEGRDVARVCAINILAQVKAATGDLEKISRLVKLTVFVASTPEFTEQHLVANGASELLADVLGDRGQHARSAVGTASLPLNAPVEAEAIVELSQ